jgi:hypothetical protein
MKNLFLTIVLLMSFNAFSSASNCVQDIASSNLSDIQAALQAGEALTKSDCKKISKAVVATMDAAGNSKDEIKLAKKIINETCKVAVKEKMTLKEYSDELTLAFALLGF